MTRLRPKPDHLPLIGHRVNLRLVEESDAGFIHGLRTDVSLSEHLSPVSGTVDDQRAWISRYKVRESAHEEFYFVVETKSGVPCGLVRLYEVSPSEFTWGSIILGRNKPAKAALETALLSLKFGFETLGCARANLGVRKGNKRAISFYRRFGMRETGENDQDLFFEIDKTDLDLVSADHIRAITADGRNT